MGEHAIKKLQSGFGHIVTVCAGIFAVLGCLISAMCHATEVGTDGLRYVPAYLALFLLAVLGAWLAERYWDRLPCKILVGVWFFLVPLLVILTASYIPCHDSLELHQMLADLMQTGTLTKHSKGYTNFFVTNKLVVYLYYGAARLFGNITLGVRVLNGVLLYGSLMVTAAAARFYFGARCGRTMLVLLPVLAPYMLLSGPYIYLPAIFLMTLCFLLLAIDRRISRIFSYLVMGLLFVLRPTALAAVLVVMFLKMFGQVKTLKSAAKQLGRLALVFCVMFAVKAGLGAVFYATGFHTYPTLNSSAGLFTLEMGTRPSGDSTSGTCFYIPYELPESMESDEIAVEFQELWELCEKNSEEDYPEILALQKDLRKKIIRRAVDTICQNPQLYFKTLYYKVQNLYLDSYKPYYVKINATASSFTEDLYDNPDEEGFFYESALYALFFLSALVILWNRKTDRRGIYLVFSVLVGTMMLLLLTEVNKKMLMDMYLEIVLAIGYAVTRLAEKQTAPETKKQRALWAASALAAVAVVGVTVHSGRLVCFKNAEAEIQSDENGGQELVITLDTRYTTGDYAVILPDGTEISLKGAEQVVIPYTEKTFNLFSVRTPAGKSYSVSSQEIE